MVKVFTVRHFHSGAFQRSGIQIFLQPWWRYTLRSNQNPSFLCTPELWNSKFPSTMVNVVGLERRPETSHAIILNGEIHFRFGMVLLLEPKTLCVWYNSHGKNIEPCYLVTWNSVNTIREKCILSGKNQGKIRKFGFAILVVTLMIYFMSF